MCKWSCIPGLVKVLDRVLVNEGCGVREEGVRDFVSK
jgi:hypothetical protein